MENIEPAERLSNYFSQLFVTLPVLDIRKSFDCVPQEVFVGKLSLEFNFCTDAYTSEVCAGLRFVSGSRQGVKSLPGSRVTLNF